MIEFVCTLILVNIALRVTMVTMQCRKAQMCLFFQKHCFLIHGVPKKQFGTNAKLSLGCNVCPIRFCGIGYPILVLI